jgi:hypothetical protein
MIEGSAWVYTQKEFIADIRDDLQLICNYFSSPRILDKSSSYHYSAPQNDFRFHHVQPPIKNDSWQNNFKCQKEIWATLISNWKSIKGRYYKREEYQPFAELFERLKQYDLAAYFYQVSDGIVNKDLYYEVANQPHRGSPVVFGVEIEPKKNLIDHVLDFITQEYIVPIQVVIPLSLFILVSGWFIGTKTWESQTSATEIEKSLCSKTFQDDKNKDIKNCQVIVLDPGYSFNEIKQLIPAVVDDVVNEKTKQDQTSNNVDNNSPETLGTTVQKKTEEDIRKEDVEPKLKEILPGGVELQYRDLKPGREPTELKTQKEWITAIYNYQIKKGLKYQKIAVNANENNQCNLPILFGKCLWSSGQDDSPNNVTDVKNSELYKKLKADILAAMKPQQSQGINSPSQSLRKPGN